MSDSTQHLDLISSSTGSKEAQANELFDPASIALFGGRRASSTVGLTWGYYGGRIYINGVATQIPNSSYVGTIGLTNNATNYIEINQAGTVSVNTTGFSADKIPLYRVVTSGGAVTSHEDHRDFRNFERMWHSSATLAMGNANITLTFAQAICRTLISHATPTALTALRDIVVPAVRREWTVFANTTGGFGVRVIAASGTGITIADGMRAKVEFDGTNVVRNTPDV